MSYFSEYYSLGISPGSRTNTVVLAETIPSSFEPSMNTSFPELAVMSSKFASHVTGGHIPALKYEKQNLLFSSKKDEFVHKNPFHGGTERF